MDNNRIEISDADRQMWHKTLQLKLGASYDYDLVENKIDECIEGWEKAPGTFEQRLDRKFFHKPPPRKKFVEIEEKISDEDLNDPLLDALKPEEKSFYIKRFEQYKADFGFNSSADISLLKQLVFEEVLISRCSIDRLSTKKDRDHVLIEEMLNNANKRLIDLQKTLGIARDKRKDQLDNQAGDIASLSESLDIKLKKFPETNAKYLKEEEYYLHLKSNRPEINVLPPLESLKEMEQDKLEVLIEQAVKDYNEVKVEEPKPELPLGSKV